MRQMANKEHLTFKYQMGEVHCRERKREHVTKTAYIEELRTCPETRRVYHVTESLYFFFVNFTSDRVMLYVNGY